MEAFPSAESKFKKPGAPTQTKRPTIAGFVSTSVLESDRNGLFSAESTETVRDRSEEEERRLALQAQADARPLYERLQEQKEAKDAAWKEANNPFQAPKGLDEEDIAFLEERAEVERDRKRRRTEQEEQDAAEYAMARAEQELGVSTVPTGAAGGAGGSGPGHGGSGGGGTGMRLVVAQHKKPKAAGAGAAAGALGGLRLKARVRKKAAPAAKQAGPQLPRPRPVPKPRHSGGDATCAAGNGPANPPVATVVAAEGAGAIGALAAYGDGSSSSDSD
eukprot:g5729.t1